MNRNIKILIVVVILQILSAIIGSLDVVPSFLIIKYLVISIANFAAIFILGIIAYSAIGKRNISKLKRILLVIISGLLIFLGLVINLFFFEDDSRSGFINLYGRELKKQIDYPEYNKKIYIYDWGGIPDGYESTEIKIQVGISPFAHTLAKIKTEIEQVRQNKEILEFNVHYIQQPILKYNLRTDLVWISPNVSTITDD